MGQPRRPCPRLISCKVASPWRAAISALAAVALCLSVLLSSCAAGVGHGLSEEDRGGAASEGNAPSSTLSFCPISVAIISAPSALREQLVRFLKLKYPNVDFEFLDMGEGEQKADRRALASVGSRHVDLLISLSDSASDSANGNVTSAEGGSTVQGDAVRYCESLSEDMALVVDRKLPLLAFVNFGNLVSGMTSRELREVGEGLITNWAQLGGRDVPLTIYLRDSGNFFVDSYLQELFKGAILAGKAVFLPRGFGVTEQVMRDPGALFVGLPQEADFRMGLLDVDGRNFFQETRAGRTDYFGLRVRVLARKDLPAQVKIRLGQGELASKPVALSSIAETLAEAFSYEEAPVAKLVAVGDIIPGRTVAKIMVQSNDFIGPFAKVADRLREADITVANFEVPLTDRFPPPYKGMLFSAPTRAAEGLVYSGIDLVNLANNHTTNFGEGPFLDLLKTLQKHGIKYVGGGANSEEAHKAEIVEAGGLKFAFLGYNDVPGAIRAQKEEPGVAWIDRAEIATDLQKARRLADFVVVVFHWGIEYKDAPSPAQIEVGRFAVDNGAGLVIGTHPHVVEGIEFYKDNLITYSLGNFIFDQMWSLKTRQGVVLEAFFFGGKLASVRFIPYEIEDFNQPHFLGPDEGRPILERMLGASINVFPTN